MDAARRGRGRSWPFARAEWNHRASSDEGHSSPSVELALTHVRLLGRLSLPEISVNALAGLQRFSLSHAIPLANGFEWITRHSYNARIMATRAISRGGEVSRDSTGGQSRREYRPAER
jgi:hypothetical protein